MAVRAARSEAAGILTMALLRQGNRPDRGVEACFGGGGLGLWYFDVARECLRAKAQRFDADGGDACGCRVPLEGVVGGLSVVDGLWRRVCLPAGVVHLCR